MGLVIRWYVASHFAGHSMIPLGTCVDFGFAVLVVGKHMSRCCAGLQEPENRIQVC